MLISSPLLGPGCSPLQSQSGWPGYPAGSAAADALAVIFRALLAGNQLPPDEGILQLSLLVFSPEKSFSLTSWLIPSKAE